MLDLLTPVIPEERLHKNFQAIRNEKDVHKILQSWALGFVDRDNKFVKEFQESFNSSFWELYLHAVFGNLGFKTDYSYHAPDYLLEKKGHSVIVEAVTTRNPEHGTPEHDSQEKIRELLKKTITDEERAKNHEKLISLATERIANSINSKSKMYLEKYAKLNHVKDKPFIVAVGSFEQPLFYYQAQGAIQRVIYGLTKAEYRNGEPYFEYSDHVIKETNGAKIPIGLFNDESYSHISAVIFSPIATFGKLRALQSKKEKNIIFETYKYNKYGEKGTIETVPHKKYRESLLDGLSVYINPHATIPLKTDLFDSPDIAINYTLHDNKVKHGFLYSRHVINIRSKGTNEREIIG